MLFFQPIYTEEQKNSAFTLFLILILLILSEDALQKLILAPQRKRQQENKAKSKRQFRTLPIMGKMESQTEKNRKTKQEE